ncbi:MAG: nodulation protein NfeD [Candidatus Delongbacteria bacterium]|nr:nodulation protein NfeD [Candidatus Delongbacteria bacterium]
MRCHFTLLSLAALLILLPATFALQHKTTGLIHTIEISSAITPVTAEFVEQAVEDATAAQAECLVIQLDTPGGLMKSMRSVIKAIMASGVPVVVYVAPGGAQCASAGVFIAFSAHVAAMAPGTNIGAAHPVSLGQQPDSSGVMLEKVTNDAVAYIRSLAEKRKRNADWAEEAVRESVSITETEALELKVIDLVSVSLDSLLAEIDGMEIDTVLGKRQLHTATAEIELRVMDWRMRLLEVITDPNIAYILLLIGIYGIFFELYNPGVILPGVVGGISLILGFYALQMLPVNYAGLGLILFGIILFIAEIKVTSFGLLSVGGTLSLLMGSIMLIDSTEEFMQISWSVIIPGVLFTALFFMVAIGLGIKAQRRRRVSGTEGMIGEIGRAHTEIAPEGTVSIRGEFWSAVSNEPIPAGSKVRVLEVEKLELKVVIHS